VAGQEEYYAYDGLSQLTNMDRTIAGIPFFEEDFWYDPTGNWRGSTSAYVTKTNGSVDLNQNRSHNSANEITGITTSVGTAWTAPTQDLVGNMTVIPQPSSPNNTYDCKYDAWNRLVEVKITGGAVQGTYKYDGLNRRMQSITSNTRDFYYSNKWQILEERVGGVLERQNFWGLRSDDDLVLRHRDSNSDGTLDQKAYALHDEFHLTALIDASAVVQERYGYDCFGNPRVMTAAFGPGSVNPYTTDFGFGGYRWDKESGLYQVRHRFYHARLGRWLSRDPIDYEAGTNLYAYVGNCPINAVDPVGLNGSSTSLAKLPVL
jgi:RHS repeat-associated protein